MEINYISVLIRFLIRKTVEYNELGGDTLKGQRFHSYFGIPKNRPVLSKNAEIA